ncbi:MAG: hypothetical protein ABMA25_16610 [Ilumatobacteraceae bacterium]
MDRVVLARRLRLLAFAAPCVKVIGSIMWLSAFPRDEGRVWYVFAALPITVALGAVLYAATVLLARPDPVPPKAPVVPDPVVTASVLDLDAPISHTVFQPPTSAPTTVPAIPIGDPHAAFRRD